MGCNKPTKEQLVLKDLNLKRCGVCKEIYHVDVYAKAKRNWLGLSYHCRACQAAKQRNRRARCGVALNAKEREYSREYQRKKRMSPEGDWYARNPDAVKNKWKRDSEKRSASPQARLRMRISSGLRRVLKGSAKTSASFTMVGYSACELKLHIERQFLKGMSWENMGDWHIDHIIPLSSFDISGPDDPELKVAWGLPNLRPLWEFDNISKGAKRTFLC